MSLVGSPAAAENPRSKLDRALRDASRQGSVHRVIIQTRPGTRLALRNALASHGDIVESEHASLEALTVTLHGEDLAVLQANPDVVAISIDAEVTAFGAKPRRAAKKAARDTEVDLRDTLGLSTIPFDGTGINVAVVDSGIDPTRNLAANIAGFWDFTHSGVLTRPRDEYGHGTHVAGLIASTSSDPRKQFAGVAPGVRLYGFQVLDAKGRGRVSDVVNALDFIVRNKLSDAPDAFKIDVINLSLGHPVYEPAATDPLVRAVENAVRAGIVVVTAAGNIGVSAGGDTGYTGITSPGNAPSAITVGAADTRNTVSTGDDRVALFSSRGPTWFDGMAKPDLVAPGVNLISDAPKSSSLFKLYPQLRELARNGQTNYGRLSGTSMAAAVTTGVTSLVLQASRWANHGVALSPNALKAVLQYTALPLEDAGGVAYDALTQGTGELNTRGAVALALAIDTGMPRGSQWLRVAPPPLTRIGGDMVAWSRALLWDDNIVWGTDALAFNSPQWDDNIVWGTALASDDNIVWGTAADLENIVWGTSVVWADDLVWGNRLVGLMDDADNIVWGTADGLTDENIVWGTYDGENIVWGTWELDNIVWGTSDAENIVWGTFLDADNIVWGTYRDADNIVWGTVAGARR
jgi:serine protease AprX